MATASAITDAAGHFALPVPVGPVRLTIRRIGLAPDTIAVPAGQDSVVIFARVLAIPLDSVGVVTDAARARARFDTLAQPSIVTLSTREILRAPGVFEPDLMRTIQLLPGTVARNDYSTGYNVRGGETDQNLVQLDGVTIFNPSHVGGLFSAFDINAVQQADFLTAGFPASYSGRLSSVLDVTLRPGSRERVKGSAAVSLLSSKLLVEGPAGPASFLLSARRSYADQVVKVLTSETLPYQFTDLMGKIDLPYGRGGDLAVTGYWGTDALSPNLIPAAADGTGAIDLDFHWGNRLVGLELAPADRRRRGSAGAAPLLQRIREPLRAEAGPGAVRQRRAARERPIGALLQTRRGPRSEPGYGRRAVPDDLRHRHPGPRQRIRLQHPLPAHRALGLRR